MFSVQRYQQMNLWCTAIFVNECLMHSDISGWMFDVQALHACENVIVYTRNEFINGEVSWSNFMVKLTLISRQQRPHGQTSWSNLLWYRVSGGLMVKLHGQTYFDIASTEASWSNFTVKLTLISRQQRPHGQTSWSNLLWYRVNRGFFSPRMIRKYAVQALVQSV
jgi:hypothetical protein